jgi:hypothetical protein
MTHCVEVARRRGHNRKRFDQDSVAPRIPKGQTSRIRHWKGLDCSNDIRDRGLRQQLRDIELIHISGTRWQLRFNIERTAKGIYRKSTGLDIAIELPDVLLGYRESKIGPCGGVDPLKKKKLHVQEEPVM